MFECHGSRKSNDVGKYVSTWSKYTFVLSPYLRYENRTGVRSGVRDTGLEILCILVTDLLRIQITQMPKLRDLMLVLITFLNREN